jgi:membrane fusion protein (multidrug efflux system)
VLGLAAAVLLLLVAGGVLVHRHLARYETTDNAFIEGEIVRISPRVAGHVGRVAVDDNQRAREGQLLVELDARPFEAALAEARGRLASIEAEAARAAADAKRAEELFGRQLIARAALDEAVARARSTAAQVEAARAEVARAELDLSYTRIAAPEAGRVTRKTVEPGMFVQVGQPLLAIVTDRIWVVANFKETQLDDIRAGQPVDVRVDAYPGVVLRAHVDSIQSGSGARFSLLPPENATGNYVKVVQRVPVKIVFDAAPDPSLSLGPGMSVVPKVRVR